MSQASVGMRYPILQVCFYFCFHFCIRLDAVVVTAIIKCQLYINALSAGVNVFLLRVSVPRLPEGFSSRFYNMIFCVYTCFQGNVPV